MIATLSPCRDTTPALLDPERATPSVVAGPKGKAARQRYNVYRNNVTVSLINALAVAFPTVPDGWPLHVTWAAMALAIMAWGPGRISLDHLIERRRA